MKIRASSMLGAAVALAAVAAVAAGVAIYLRMPSSTPVKEAPAAPVAAAVDSIRFNTGAAQLSAIKVEPVRDAPLPLAEPLNGRLAYNENFTARVAAPVAGRVTSLKAQPGDSVNAGDILLMMDSPDLAAAVADVQKAVSDEGRKRLALDRTRQLVDAGVVPRKDLENAQADFDGARAETERAQRRLRNLTPRGGPPSGGTGFALRSPITGIVADRKVNPGSEVRPDLPDPLYTITDPTKLWVLVDLPERDLAKVQLRRPASVQVDAYPDLRFTAVVERIGEVVDPATRRVQLRAGIDNADRKLKPEMYARITLIADAGETAVRVPNSALVTQGLYSYVFVETEPGAFKRREVKLSVQDREFAYVATGLVAGERLVTSGALLLNSELSTAR